MKLTQKQQAALDRSCQCSRCKAAEKQEQLEAVQRAIAQFLPKATCTRPLMQFNVQ